MEIRQALREHEENVDAAIKAASKYLAALKSWKKACRLGHVANRRKAAESAVDLAPKSTDSTRIAADSWDFDVRGYLESGAWREELHGAATIAGLRVLEEQETLLSPPVIVRAQPGQDRLMIGKVAWPTLNPDVTVAHLKALSERTASAAASQQFLNALYDGCVRVSRAGDLSARFRELYDLFCLAPGWAKENSAASFGQQIHALHNSGVRTTRDGKTFEFEFPSGKPKDRDKFSVISEDGREIDYYVIWFR